MTRQYYSMKIATPKDHRMSAKFVQPQFHRIETKTDFDRLIARLRAYTISDKQGRILCYGTPAYSYAEQKRMYVVKWGHDDRVWDELTAQGDAIRQQLP